MILKIIVIISKNIKKNQTNILCENFYSGNLVNEIKTKIIKQN